MRLLQFIWFDAPNKMAVTRMQLLDKSVHLLQELCSEKFTARLVDLTSSFDLIYIEIDYAVKSFIGNTSNYIEHLGRKLILVLGSETNNVVLNRATAMVDLEELWLALWNRYDARLRVVLHDGLWERGVRPVEFTTFTDKV